MNITYNIQTQPKDDPWIDLAERANQFGSDTVNTGKYLVEVFPIRERGHFLCLRDLTSDHCSTVRYIPAWFPGAKFQRDARYGRRLGLAMLHEPFEHAKR